VAAARREAGRIGDARKDKKEAVAVWVWWRVEEEGSTARKAAWKVVAMAGERGFSDMGRDKAEKEVRE
jgi:hypothetical protein